jgi:hypothetical protein
MVKKIQQSKKPLKAKKPQKEKKTKNKKKSKKSEKEEKALQKLKEIRKFYANKKQTRMGFRFCLLFYLEEVHLKIDRSILLLFQNIFK